MRSRQIRTANCLMLGYTGSGIDYIPSETQRVVSCAFPLVLACTLYLVPTDCGLRFHGAKQRRRGSSYNGIAMSSFPCRGLVRRRDERKNEVYLCQQLHTFLPPIPNEFGHRWLVLQGQHCKHRCGTASLAKRKHGWKDDDKAAKASQQQTLWE